MKESTGWMLLAEDMEPMVGTDVDMWICLILENLMYSRILGYLNLGYMNFLERSRKIPVTTLEKMQHRFQAHIDWDNQDAVCYYEGPQSWYRDTSVHQCGGWNDRRVLACLWLSLEAESEGD